VSPAGSFASNPEAASVTALEATEAEPVPMLLVAVTLKV
jgi:hypothetical protein